jgi:hypothetical protein
VSDRELESGLAAWMALRRAHQGGVTTLQDHWFDAGRLVPCYVADALDELTRTGLLVLSEADPEFGGARRVMVTDTGSAHYVALCEIHNPTATVAVSTPRRWAYSPHDQRNHLLTERGTHQIGAQVGVCGHRMAWSVSASAQLTSAQPAHTQPAERSCLTCEALATLRVPASQFSNSPDSGRPPAETAPGGRPDTTTQSGPVGLRVPDPQFPTTIPAARTLQDSFLANADRGDDDANDELVAEVLRRIRAQRASHEGGC